jgi:small conductance mechanosensitive channel
VAVLLAAISRVGVDTTSFLAVVGSLGLAVGLAMKDNLSNVSSGVMLILLRPFTLGDYIEVAGVQGTVKAISLTATVLATADNQRILVPNTKVTGEIIRNVTANDTRRIDLTIGIGYGDDVARARPWSPRCWRATRACSSTLRRRSPWPSWPIPASISWSGPGCARWTTGPRAST